MVTDTNSTKEDIDKIQEILNKSNIENKFQSIDLDSFKDKINQVILEQNSLTWQIFTPL